MKILMKVAEAKQYFGNGSRLAKALNIKPEAVCQWGEYVPELRAWEIKYMTKNKVPADIDKEL